MNSIQLGLVVVGGLVTLASAVKATVFLARAVRSLVHKLDAIDELLQQELTHNHGSSIKDDVHGMAMSIGGLQREQDEERSRMNAVLKLAATHHPEAAALYLALMRRHKP